MSVTTVSKQPHLLADYLSPAVGQLSSTLLARLQKGLRSQNVELFINVLKSVFAGIPHMLFLTQEAYYHSLVYLLLKLLGFTSHAEPLTNLGRIDAVLELPEAIYCYKMPRALCFIHDGLLYHPRRGRSSTAVRKVKRSGDQR